MSFARTTILRMVPILAVIALPATLSAQGLPLKRGAQPTTAAISENDLMSRLYVFADDSMQGRQVGREGNMKGTDYIARELRRLGIEPAGENGTYFQGLPYVVRRFTPQSMLRAGGRALSWNEEWLAVPGQTAPKPFTGGQVIYGGVQGDTTKQVTREQAAGKIVVLTRNPAPPTGGLQGGGGPGGFGGGAAAQRFADAAAIVTVDLHTLGMSARALINNPAGTMTNTSANAQPPRAAPPQLRITEAAAAQLFGGRAPAQLQPGEAGVAVEARLAFIEQEVPQYARNVIGIIRGSDPALRGQYVAIGAHNDHVGFTGAPVDHDSLRAWRSEMLKRQMRTGDLVQLSQEEQAEIVVNVDSLRRIRPVRRDSIRNGADDDGSGSMALLEIAEAISRAPVKPRRSILLVWHTGEENGLRGAAYFVANPTVPRDSIVTQLNIDMIGRGMATDLPGGGPDYVGVVGSRMLSTDLGDAVVSINNRQPTPLRIDYRFDEETTWPGYNNIYGRSDHAHYARAGIPIAFFFTGLHQDYHQVTDEPQYIDYPHYARITRMIHDLALEIGNRDRRPAITKPAT